MADETYFARMKELQASGMSSHRAFREAVLERRIADWPTSMDGDLPIIIFGDFAAPAADISFGDLKITVLKEPLKSSLIQNATMVLQARVEVADRSLAGLSDAARRVNLLLGSFTLTEHTNPACGWWCDMTHGLGGSVVTRLDNPAIPALISLLKTPGNLKLPKAHEITRKLEAALFWLQEPRPLMLDFRRNEIFRTYVAYWNVFECLVDVVSLIHPPAKSIKGDKTKAIKQILTAAGDSDLPAAISECYAIVNPPFRSRAEHVLLLCLGGDADKYFHECFTYSPGNDQLYKIRNSINHGDIDASDVGEWWRVEDRLLVLVEMLFKLFAYLFQWLRQRSAAGTVAY